MTNADITLKIATALENNDTLPLVEVESYLNTARMPTSLKDAFRNLIEKVTEAICDRDELENA